MGAIYLPGTINSPKRCIATFNNGYVMDIRNNIIGRYDDGSIYESGSLTNPCIGRIRFNFGYVAESNDIFVKATRYGELKATNDVADAYFEGDEKGAIATFIICYKLGMISINNSYHKQRMADNKKGIRGLQNLPMPVSEEESSEGMGCGMMLGITIFVIAAIITSIKMWGEFGSYFLGNKDVLPEGESFLELWPFFILIAAAIIGHVINKSNGYKDILGTYLIVFVVAIIMAAIITSFKYGLVCLLAVPLALVILAWPVLLIAIIVTSIIAKRK